MAFITKPLGSVRSVTIAQRGRLDARTLPETDIGLRHFRIEEIPPVFDGVFNEVTI
jgi:hypothetical protein